MRFFNTAGPTNCEKHYCLSPLDRFDLNEITFLINHEKYFVLHAPRQTGKTTCLLALMDYLNKEGKYKCLYINVESAQGAREDVAEGVKAILNELAMRARIYLQDLFIYDTWKNIFDKSGKITALNEMLTIWVEESDLPIVLLIDEIDSLIGDTLISVLRQLRSGYDRRPNSFPQSVILCGVRDVRDYRIHSSKEKAIITGGSAFNIKAESLRLDDFTKGEVNILYNQHTKETGQVFEPESIDFAWKLTSGQPWLVNALGYEACFKMKDGRDRLKPVTKLMIEQAKDNIILRHETHIDQLVDKLKEERVKRVVNPMLQGLDMEHASEDDIQYVLDIGLVCKSPQGLQVANRIYREVIPRHLTVTTQYNLESRIDPLWYIGSDGRIDMEKLLFAFQEFFREHSEHWIERFQYKEAGPQLLLQAFLQRIVNSGGRVEREYGLGRMRTDLLVIWQVKAQSSRLKAQSMVAGAGQTQKVVIELKILYKSLETTIKEGLSQTAKYMDRCGTSDGHLIIFDRREDITWDEKIFRCPERYKDREIVVWGM